MLKNWPGKIDPFKGQGMRLFRMPGFPSGFVFGGCCATLILVPIFTMYQSQWVPKDVVDRAARPFIDHLSAGDIEGAYPLTGPEFQRTTPPDRMRGFSSFLNQSLGRTEAIRFEGLRSAVPPEQPSVFAYYKLYGNRGDVRVRLLMSRHAGAWQVLSFTLDPLPKRAVVRKGVPAS